MADAEDWEAIKRLCDDYRSIGRMPEALELCQTRGF